jgi:hypothetical protein
LKFIFKQFGFKKTSQRNYTKFYLKWLKSLTSYYLSDYFMLIVRFLTRSFISIQFYSVICNSSKNSINLMKANISKSFHDKRWWRDTRQHSTGFAVFRKPSRTYASYCTELQHSRNVGFTYLYISINNLPTFIRKWRHKRVTNIDEYQAQDNENLWIFCIEFLSYVNP